MIAMEMTSAPPNQLNGAGGTSTSTQEAPTPPLPSSVVRGGIEGSSSTDVEEPGHHPSTARRRNSLPGGFSGLSALIQAATSQLGHLIDDTPEGEAGSGSSSSNYGDHRGVYQTGSPRHIRTGVAPRRQSWHPPPSPPSLGPSVQVSRSPSRERRQLSLKDLRGNKPGTTATPPTTATPAGATLNDLTESPPMSRREDPTRTESTRLSPTSSTTAPEPDPNKQSFPELLMALSLNPDNVDVITFLPDGKFFAMRSRPFAETIMTRYFAVTTIEQFLDLANDWGFSRILSNPDSTAPRDIEVFRHPSFVKGDWARCSTIKFGETPAHARVSALPEMSRIVSAASATSTTTSSAGGVDNHPTHNNETDAASTPMSSSAASTTPPSAAATHDTTTVNSGSCNNTKRRLSPGFLHRRESESSVSSQKLRMRSPGGGGPAVEVDTATSHNTEPRRESVDSDNELSTIERLPSPTTAKVDELRSIALSITTEKLKLKCDDTTMDDVTTPTAAGDSSAPPPQSTHSPHHHHSTVKLVDRAVESATHTIVTDAIETLLRDEGHTKITYLKHERELSVSSIPGVVPISKQLFSPDSSSSATGARAPPPTGASTNSTSATANGSGMLPLSIPEPAEITPPLQPKNSQNGVPETPLDAPTGAAASSPGTAMVPSGSPPTA